MPDGSLLFDTKMDPGGFESGLKRIESTASKVLGSLGLALSAGAIAKGLISLGKQSTALASDLQEVQNVVDVTFGASASKVGAWAKAAKDAYGMSELSAKQYAGTMGAMLKSMGLADAAVLEMSTDLTGLAGDFASFYNIASEEAFAKIRSGISGETEPLKQLGINMSVANLEAYALSEGLETAYSAMTQAEQATLRYNYLLSVSADAQGDFARTSDSYANVQRKTELAIENVGTAIGQRLIPAVTKGTKLVGDLADGAADAISERGVRGGIDYITAQMPVATAAVSGLVAAYGAMSVIKTVQGLTEKYSKAQSVLTTMLKTGTAAEIAEAGVLTAKQAILGVYTGKLTLAQGAQALFNATVMANPLVAFAAGIGAVIAGAVLLNKTLRKTHPEMFELSDAIQDCSESTKQLKADIEESAAAHADSIEAIEKEAFKNRQLADSLAELSANYTGTVADQRRMDAYCEKLSGSVDGLTVSYNKETGAIEGGIDALYEKIDAMADLARKNAAMHRYTELVGQSQDAEWELYRAQTAYNEAMKSGVPLSQQQSNQLRGALKTAEEAVAQTGDAVVAYEGYMSDAGYATETAAASADALAEAEGKVADAVDAITPSLQALALSYQDAYDSAASSMEGQFDLWDSVGEKVKLTKDQIIQNVAEQAKYFDEYADNIEALSARGIEGIDALVAKYSDGSAESVAAIAALGSATDAELSGIVSSLNERDINIDRIATAAATAEVDLSGSLDAIAEQYSALITNINGTSETVDMSGFVTAVQTAFTDAGAEFESAGGTAADGFAAGLEANSGGASSASTAMAQAVIVAARSALDSHSPSRVMQQEGENAGEGFALGLEASSVLAETAGASTINNIKEAMVLAVGTAGFADVGNSIAAAIVEPFAGLEGTMRSYGVNAMQGFISGVNSKKSAVQRAIENIANSVKKTFTVKVEIQSPSKVFERYGEFTVQGYIDGIDARLGLLRTTMDKFADVATLRDATALRSAAYPAAPISVRELPASAAAPAGNVTNVTQHIHGGQSATPAQLLREAKWQQERAVLTGV